jgi:hypothetical protein
MIKVEFVKASGSFGEDWGMKSLKEGITEFTICQRVCLVFPSVWVGGADLFLLSCDYWACIRGGKGRREYRT